MNFDVKEWSKKTNENCNNYLKKIDAFINSWIEKALIHHNKTLDQVELEQYYQISLPPKYILVDKETKKKLLEIIPEEKSIYSNIAFSYNAEIIK